MFFLRKPPIPENMDEAWEFSKKLSSVGMSITKYKEYYNMANEERCIYCLYTKQINTHWSYSNLVNT